MNQDELWDAYNSLLISEDVDRVRKLIVRANLLQSVLNVPGSIAECGVFKGAGLFYWLKLIKIFCPGSLRKVYGFDTFDSFSSHLLDYERESAGSFVNEAAFAGVRMDDLLALASRSGFHNVQLVKGEVSQTIPRFCSENQGLRFALINLDFDTYEGTKAALDGFLPMMSPGSIIILDEYGKSGWGESDAVDEFIEKTGYCLRSVEFASQPSAYIKIPG